MNNLWGIYTIWYRDLLRFWRDKARMVTSLAFPLLFLVVFGSGLSGSMGMLAPGVNFSKFIFPGIIGMTVLITSFMSGVSVVWDREFGFLKEVLVAPISRVAVAAGKTLGGATIALIQGTLILVFAPLFGVTFPLKILPQLLPVMFLVACALSAMGIFLGSRIKSMEAHQAVMQLLMFPMIFLSGVFFPVNNLPLWMNVLVKINPVTYGVDSIRQLVLGAEPAAALGITIFGHTMSIAEDLMIVAAFGVLMVVLAMWSFGSQE
ncbi:MAG: ABC transporter permease [Deltaproteobacteria bacterium]|nr:ABC transporter permease [Deltaproteobacteria bacterium]